MLNKLFSLGVAIVAFVLILRYLIPLLPMFQGFAIVVLVICGIVFLIKWGGLQF